MPSQKDLADGATPAPVWRRPTAGSLMTYSAVTWNPHRIHYDREYVRGLDHADLVVHGALVADWALQWVAQAYPSAGPVRRFTYRLRAPAYVDRRYQVGGAARAGAADGVTAVAVQVRDESGTTILDGEVICAAGVEPGSGQAARPGAGADDRGRA